MPYKIAVVGATGNVGREILATLAERDFPNREVIAVASKNSAGKEVSFGEEDILKVQDLAEVDFSDVDIVLSSPGSAISAEFAPKAAEAGEYDYILGLGLVKVLNHLSADQAGGGQVIGVEAVATVGDPGVGH